jgi:hypothetical protein
MAELLLHNGARMGGIPTVAITLAVTRPIVRNFRGSVTTPDGNGCVTSWLRQKPTEGTRTRRHDNLGPREKA